MNRLPELTDWDAMPFSAAEKRRRREAERNAALRGNPDALEKRAREAARKKRQREAAEAERARKRRRKGELRVANSISSAIAAAATNKALSDAAALARYDRLLLYERVALEYLCRTETYLSIDASAASGLARAAADVDAARRASCGKLPVVAGPMCSSGRRPTIGGPLLELDDFYAETIAAGGCFYAAEARHRGRGKANNIGVLVTIADARRGRCGRDHDRVRAQLFAIRSRRNFFHLR